MIAAVACGMLVAGLALTIALLGDLTLREFGDSYLLTAVVVAAAGPLVAGAILTRHPRHPVGVLMLVAALVSPIAVVVTESVLVLQDAALVSELSSASRLALWFGLSAWAFVDLPFVLLTPLFFPDGRLPSRRWRILVVLVVVFVAVVGTAYAVAVAPHGLPATTTVDAWADDSRVPTVPWAAAADAVVDAALLAYPLLALASISSMVVRWRRAGTVQRLQLRWALAGLGVGVPLAAIGVFLLTVADSEQLSTAGILSLTVGFLAVPTSMGVAIVRYRLFDLDRLVSRTLSYLLLTVVLTVVFLGTVIGTSALVQGEFGAEPPRWSIAVSTVLAYGLFSPLRRRLQRIIDGRVHRRVVDAEATMERAGRRLSEDVELASLTGVIHDVVTRTMAPSTVAVWLPRPHEDLVS